MANDDLRAAGSRRPRIADVAKAAGVSITTVSHALSNTGRVQEQTRERVLRVADELGYRPSPRATALRRGRSRTIAIASSMHTAVAGGASRQGFYLELAAAAAERAFDHGYALVLVPPALDVQLRDALAHLSVDGLLVVEPAAGDPIVETARNQQMPWVSLGSFPGARPGDLQVDLRPHQVAGLVVDHLVDLGVRSPALLLGDRDRSSYDAIEAAYLAAAGAHGWAPCVQHVPEAEGEEGGFVATQALLADRPDVDAVIAWVDAFAVGALRAVAGRDVRVATRYDGPRARSATPQLTSVQLHLPDAATAGVDLLLTALGEQTGVPTQVPAPELVVRASSAEHQQQA